MLVKQKYYKDYQSFEEMHTSNKEGMSFPKSNVLCSIWQTYLKLEMTIAMIRSIEVHLDSGLILFSREVFYFVKGLSDDATV